MDRKQKLIVAAISGAVGAAIGRKYVWKHTNKWFESFLPSYARWMRECPMHEAIIVGATMSVASQALIEVLEDEMK